MPTVQVVKEVRIAGRLWAVGDHIDLSPNMAMHHVAEGNVRLVPPPYETRKALRDATLRVGREKE